MRILGTCHGSSQVASCSSLLLAHAPRAAPAGPPPPRAPNDPECAAQRAAQRAAKPTTAAQHQAHHSSVIPLHEPRALDASPSRSKSRLLPDTSCSPWPGAPPAARARQRRCARG
ncbi:hypothetical protein MNEG_14743 [Monoraphidium neglectum]|uniref:Uncharacterized protein n=1 Tax=Monoraphidium neglectum TaxID=145388 RepID=A0A0D2LN49_9CHLO|nr:hypothetical protein MNEG_14743 [Monoraphidium neglectum]KIY93219.1 hypothetical protein MNEG_14743 [Monoraphidium neglectum]|eukprot:XP_013892239.1 hypothetical protein MNEG_14743 [Monoraphidium neglectum]